MDYDGGIIILFGSGKGREPMRFLRWAYRLSEYSCSVSYKPGAQDIVSTSGRALFFLNEPLSTIDDELNVRTIFGEALLDALLLNNVADAAAV